MASTVFNSAKERQRFLRFAVVGMIGAVIDFGSFNLMVGRFGVHHVLASVLSFSAAVTSNFIWHRFWTYPDSRQKSIRRQLMQFIVVSITGLSIRTPIFSGLETLFGKLLATVRIPANLPDEFLQYNLALAGAVGTVMLWNFFINRYWTYNDVDEHPAAAELPRD